MVISLGQAWVGSNIDLRWANRGKRKYCPDVQHRSQRRHHLRVDPAA